MRNSINGLWESVVTAILFPVWTVQVIYDSLGWLFNDISTKISDKCSHLLHSCAVVCGFQFTCWKYKHSKDSYYLPFFMTKHSKNLSWIIFYYNRWNKNAGFSSCFCNRSCTRAREGILKSTASTWLYGKSVTMLYG